MTMMQKMQAKQSKKGFTLVELVIVIAILAILAAIAIPVITTTINSAKISTLESDATTVDMVLKEAVNNSLASITATTYNGTPASGATVKDVLEESNLDVDAILGARTIGGETYGIIWSAGNAIPVSGYGDDFDGTDSIADLAPDGTNATVGTGTALD